jgi:glyoxylase-like metal-dependent hydrolase (beta-lactamase superfamily II)
MKLHIFDLNFLGHQDTIAAFLIENKNDLILVETGPHSTYPVLKKAIENSGFDIKNIKHVFLSHIHFDHAGAAWCFAQEGATIYVHPAGEKHLIDPTKLYNSAKMIYQDKMDILWGQMHGIEQSQLHTTQHGEIISIGDISFQAWHTPGHAVHHIAWQVGDMLFAGDIAGCKIRDGIVVPPCPPPDINIEEWMESLNLIKNLKLEKIYLTHFGEVKDIKKHINSLKKCLKNWANFIKKRYDKGLSAEVITPQFQLYVQNQLERNSITGEHAAQYESANPAWMSVAGLMRYWSKKAQ